MMLQKLHRFILSDDKNYCRAAIFLICLPLFAVACIPQNSGVPDDQIQGTIDFSEYEESFEELPGTWDWLRTTHFDTIDGIPDTETPASSGIHKTLRISDNQQIEIVQIAEGDTTSTTEPLESFLQNVRWGIRGDTLATKVKAYEGPETVYIRKKEN